MKKILAISTAATLSLGGAFAASPALALGENNPTFATSAFGATEGVAFDQTLSPTFSGSESWYYGSRAFLDVVNCDALPSGLSYVQDGVENGNGVAPTYQISGTPAVGTAGVYNICFQTDENPEGWFSIGTSQTVTITVEAAQVATAINASVASVATGENVTVSVTDATEGSWVGWFINGIYVDGADATVFPQIVGYNDFVFENPAIDNVVTWAVYAAPQLEATIANALSTVDVTFVASVGAPEATSTGPVAGEETTYLNSGVAYTSANFVWSSTATVSATGLPDGLAVSVDGYNVDGSPIVVVTGTPTALGDYNTQITITDGEQSASFNQVFNIAAAPAPTEPINTDNGSSSGTTDFNNTDAFWEMAENGSGSISDGGTTNTNDAYDDFGYVYGVNWDGSSFLLNATTEPVVTADSISYTSENVWSHDAQEYVDVNVTRTFIGNTVTWNLEVVKTGTSVPSTLSMFIDGNLGSDSSTTWVMSNGKLTSNDGFDGDPVITWSASAGAEMVTEDGNDDPVVNFANAGTASLQQILIGYDCADSISIQEYVDGITANYSSNVNQNIAELNNCVAPVTPTVTIDNNVTFVNGTEDAQSVGVTAEGDWNWTYGGSVSLSGLPTGLDYTVVDEWVDGVVPSFQVTGVADDVPGDYTVTVTLTDDYGNSAESTFVVTVEAAVVVIDSSLSLNQPVGSNIADTGADYAAEGLQEGSEWTLTLRSTPQVISQGTVDATGVIGGTATIPAGLEAGWHSLTLTGTDVNGDPISSVVWFELSADGTILAEQTTEPTPAPTPTPTPEPTPAAAEVAYTGANVMGTLGLGAGILALGALVLSGSAFRRKESN